MLRNKSTSFLSKSKNSTVSYIIGSNNTLNNFQKDIDDGPANSLNTVKLTYKQRHAIINLHRYLK